MNYSRMNSIAEEKGFAVCYPQGTNNSLTDRHASLERQYKTYEFC